MTPATPGDAYALLRNEIECPDPVIFIETKRPYWSKETTVLDHAGSTLDRAIVRLPGSDVTLIAYGGTLHTALEAADAAAEEGRSIEVVDLRSLSPFDDETVTASVRRTGRAVVVHEASRFCGYGAEVAARLSEQCFHYLEAPVLRVTGFDILIPRRTWRNITCPASTASSTRSTACSGRRPAPPRRRTYRCPRSSCRIWARA